MRIACPSCEAVYDVPDGLLAAGGRRVRCVRCDHEWLPAPLDEAATPDPDPDPDPVSAEAEADDDIVVRPGPAWSDRVEPRQPAYRIRDDDDAKPLPRFVPPPPPPPPARGALVGWVLSLLLLAGACYGAVSWRGKVMAAWPPSTRLYATLGMR
jgi:predicted Zn finger-like uncharacterized protein